MDAGAGAGGLTGQARAGVSSHMRHARQCEALGLLHEAAAAYRMALAIDADMQPARRRLAAMLVRMKRLAEAMALFESTGPETGGKAYDWLQDEVNAALERQEYDLAGSYAGLAAKLRWGSPIPEGQPARPTPSFPVTAAKLRHDADQLDYLEREGILVPEYRDVGARYRKVADAIAARGADARMPIQSEELRPLWPTYNRLIHLRPASRVQRAVSNSWNRRGAEACYLDQRPGVVIVDDFLTPDALVELRRFCLESTFWFANRYDHGRLGAFFQDGFNCPLLLQIAEELREALPRVIGNRYPLRQIWGFKNAPTLPPDCTTHADFAAVNVNFWITPDEANLKPDTGGMVIFDVDAPLPWDFDTYNGNPEAIRQFLTAQHARCAVVPYRQNRAVIFHSDLFHGTAEVCFRPEYEYRRINVTMLYGDRERETDHPISTWSGLAPGGQATAWRSHAFARFRR
jgi:tetratricopeptide (TPR) repeat protein